MRSGYVGLQTREGGKSSLARAYPWARDIPALEYLSMWDSPVQGMSWAWDNPAQGMSRAWDNPAQGMSRAWGVVLGWRSRWGCSWWNAVPRVGCRLGRRWFRAGRTPGGILTVSASGGRMGFRLWACGGSIVRCWDCRSQGHRRGNGGLSMVVGLGRPWCVCMCVFSPFILFFYASMLSVAEVEKQMSVKNTKLLERAKVVV